jgi:predicted CoA-binding protein
MVLFVHQDITISIEVVDVFAKTARPAKIVISALAVRAAAILGLQCIIGF